jgi:alanine-glyoxylate transaminase/serine-glyoxylate transaminase/serine-pyruvate transaminase
VKKKKEKATLIDGHTQTEEKKVKASAKMSTQPEHPAVLIPGPVEFDDAVLQSMGHYRRDPSKIDHVTVAYTV